LFLLLSSIFYLPSAVNAADEIYVTSVEKAPVEDGGAVKEMATIILNDCIKVKEIQVIKVGGRTTVRYPTYVSKRGKEYPQFEPLTKQAKEEIEEAISSGKASKKSSKKISYKVAKFSQFRGQSVLKVFCAVDFNNAVRVECKVMKGRRGPWISWPARKPEEGRKWVKQILIKKKVRKIVEKDLLDRYQKMLSEGGCGDDDDDDW